jgi:hypothetical protein
MSRISAVPFVAIFVGLLAARSPAQVIFPEPLSPRIANYRITCELDPKAKTVTGEEILTWRNTSNEVVRELQFHLYMNAFKNTETTFMKESGGVMRGQRLKPGEWGYIDMESMTTADGTDLLATLEYIAPDDGNPFDQTVARVMLPTPIRSGQTIELRIKFVTKLPKVFARTGYSGNFFLVAQWFPKIAVYQEGRGWNAHQFHANSEFFADFGVYDVSITVPKGFVVGATGVLQSTTETDTTKTLVYRAEDVHDFAWTADPRFGVAEDQFKHVKITFLYQPDHKGQARRFLDAAKNALKYFDEWYGEYPYPTLTLVDPPMRGQGAGGMEYPTLITLGATFYGLPEGLRGPELITIHEFGHQYWYGLLASNEFEEPWLDEGINTYTEMRILDDLYGEDRSMLDLLGLRIGDSDFQRASYIAAADKDRIYAPAWNHYRGTYGAMAYSKPGLMLRTLEGYLGSERMLEVMRTYVERWRFKHPTSEDFIAVANEVAGEDLSWFFDQALYGSAVLDYAIGAIRTVRFGPPQGIGFEEKKSEETETDTVATNADTTAADTVPEVVKPKAYQSTVWVRRVGDFVFPVDVLVRFEDGEEIRERWDGRDRWVKYEYRRPARLVLAEVDPERKVALDVNFLNNSRTLAINNKARRKLTLRALFWVQNLFHYIATLD